MDDKKIEEGQIWRTQSGELYAVTKTEWDEGGDRVYHQFFECGRTDYGYAWEFDYAENTLVAELFDRFKAAAKLEELVKERVNG